MPTEPIRLKQKDLKPTREKLLLAQDNKCAVCRLPISDQPMKSAVLDHNHKTGYVRAVLHRGCNALLGKIENTLAMNGLNAYSVHDFLIGASDYLLLYDEQCSNILHSSYKTAEEKKLKLKLKRSKAKK